MKSIMIKNVPETLRNEFKAVCVRKGTTMSDEFLKFMKSVVETEGWESSAQRAKKGTVQ